MRPEALRRALSAGTVALAGLLLFTGGPEDLAAGCSLLGAWFVGGVLGVLVERCP